MSDQPHWDQNLERQIPGVHEAIRNLAAVAANSGFRVATVALAPTTPLSPDRSAPTHVTFISTPTGTEPAPLSPRPMPQSARPPDMSPPRRERFGEAKSPPPGSVSKRASTSVLERLESQMKQGGGKRKRYSDPSALAPGRADPFWGTVLEKRPGTPVGMMPSRLSSIQPSGSSGAGPSTQLRDPAAQVRPLPLQPSGSVGMPERNNEGRVFRTSTLPALSFRSAITERLPPPDFPGLREPRPAVRPEPHRERYVQSPPTVPTPPAPGTHEKRFLRRTGQFLGRLSPFGASGPSSLKAPLSPPPLNVESQLYRESPLNTSGLRMLPSPPKTPVSDVLTQQRIGDAPHLFPATQQHQLAGHTPGSAFYSSALHPQSGSRSASGSGVSYAQPSRTPPPPAGLGVERAPFEQQTRGASKGKRGRKVRTPLDREQFFECDQCNSKFRRKSDKNRHVRVVHEKSRPFVCPMCEKTFGEKSNMLKHRASVHDDVRTFRCPYCDVTFSQRGLCDNHVRTVHGQKQAKYFCEHCGLPFSRKVQLKEHYEQIHPQFASTYQGNPAGPSTLPGRPSSSGLREGVRDEGVLVGDTIHPIPVTSVPLSPFTRLHTTGPSEGRTIPSAPWGPYPPSRPPAQSEYEQGDEGSSRGRSLQGDSSG